MRRNSYAAALGGVLGALAVVVMSMGALIPFATFCCPILAMLLEVPVLENCGRKMAWAWFGAVAILSCLLCPDPEAAAVFAALGYYPILRRDLNRIPLKVLRIVLKLLVFNGAILLMYAVLIWVLHLEAVAKSILEEAPWVNALILVMGNGTFILLDLLLDRFSGVFRRRK